MAEYMLWEIHMKRQLSTIYLQVNENDFSQRERGTREAEVDRGRMNGNGKRLDFGG